MLAKLWLQLSLTDMAIQFKVWLLVCHYHMVIKCNLFAKQLQQPNSPASGMYCFLLI